MIEKNNMIKAIIIKLGEAGMIEIVKKFLKSIPSISHEKLRTYDMFSTAIEDSKRNDTGVIKAEFIQHSSERVHSLINHYARTGVKEIELFLQEHNVSEILCGEEFWERLELRIREYETDLDSYRHNFKLYLYESPASLNAIKLTTASGMQILFMSWYLHFHKGNRSDNTQLSILGGTNPTLRIDSLHPQFQSFNEIFDNQVKYFKSQGTPNGKPVFEIINGRSENPRISPRTRLSKIRGCHFCNRVSP